jgi:hypothetical protein
MLLVVNSYEGGWVGDVVVVVVQFKLLDSVQPLMEPAMELFIGGGRCGRWECLLGFS